MTSTDHIEERVVEGVSPPKVFAEHRARYVFASKLVKGRRVLDVACGSGYGSRMLWDAGACEVVGADCDRQTIEYAEYRYGTEGLRYSQADACAPPELARFDVIVSFETIEHLNEPKRFLQTCQKLLVPDGLLIVSTPYRHRMRADGKPLNPFHVQEWQTDEFDDLLQEFFSDVTFFGQALKLEKKRGLPLPRSLAAPVARFQGVRLKDVHCIYPLPGPYLFGLWKSHPAYLIAVCRRPMQLK